MCFQLQRAEATTFRNTVPPCRLPFTKSLQSNTSKQRQLQQSKRRQEANSGQELLPQQVPTDKGHQRQLQHTRDEALEQRHICEIHSEILNGCLDTGSLYVCKVQGARNFIIQKVRGRGLFKQVSQIWGKCPRFPQGSTASYESGYKFPSISPSLSLYH